MTKRQIAIIVAVAGAGLLAGLIFYFSTDYALAPVLLKPKINAQSDLPPVEPLPINLLFVGDIMLDRHVREMYEPKGNDISWLLKGIINDQPDFFKGFDLMAGNLEGAVTDQGSHYPPSAGIDFAFSPDVVKQLKNYNFNFFSIANNHITDQGAKGFKETQANLTKLGYEYAGCADGAVADECAGKIVDVGGKKIAIIAASMVYRSVDREKLAAIVREYKAKSDLVIFFPHWGIEYQAKPSKAQTDLARFMIDSGVDLIIGSHPHVAQGLEIYKNHLIIYSLGNFIFDQYWSAPTQQGLVAKFAWQKDKLELSLIPVESKLSALRLMSPERAKAYLKALADVSFDLPADWWQTGHLTLDY